MDGGGGEDTGENRNGETEDTGGRGAEHRDLLSNTKRSDAMPGKERRVS
jgi:hypothetical protein